MKPQHYLILDGAQINDLIKTIYKLQKPAEVDILYLNTRYAELQEVSPVLVKVRLADPLYRKFQAEWRQTTGIHIVAQSDIYTLGNHLRSCLQAKINDQVTLFRFYDPRILTLWFETIPKEQKNRFMGPIKTIYMPTMVGEQGIQHHNDNHPTCVTPTTIWIQLNEQQLEHLTQAKKVKNKQKILQDLKQYFPKQLQPLSIVQQDELVDTSSNKANQYGSDSPMDIYLWSILLLHKGLDFPDKPAHQPYQQILTNYKELPTARLDKAIAQLQLEQDQQQTNNLSK